MSHPVDLSEFEALVPPKRSSCWFTKLSEEQQTKVLAAREAGHTFVLIAKVVTGWGVPICDTRVRTHLSGGCSCD